MSTTTVPAPPHPVPDREFRVPAAWMIGFGGLHAALVAATLGGFLSPLVPAAAAVDATRLHPLLAAAVGSVGGPPLAGWVLWVASFEALLVVDLVLLRAFVPDARAYRSFAALALAATPYLLTLHCRGSAFAGASLVLAALWLDARGARVAFVAFLALAVIAEPITLVLTPWLLMSGRGREAAAVVVIAAVACVPWPAASIGWVGSGAHGAIDPLRGVPAPPGLLVALPMVVVLLAVRATWRMLRAAWAGHPRIGAAEARAAAVSLAACTAMIVLPVEDGDPSMLLFVALGLVWGASLVPRPLVLASLVLPAAVALVSAGMPAGTAASALALARDAMVPACALVVFIALIVAAERSRGELLRASAG